jgi:hypothetical protein
VKKMKDNTLLILAALGVGAFFLFRNVNAYPTPMLGGASGQAGAQGTPGSTGSPGKTLTLDTSGRKTGSEPGTPLNIRGRSGAAGPYPGTVIIGGLGYSQATPQNNEISTAQAAYPRIQVNPYANLI